jgi:hypothetical protein
LVAEGERERTEIVSGEDKFEDFFIHWKDLTCLPTIKLLEVQQFTYGQ